MPARDGVRQELQPWHVNAPGEQRPEATLAPGPGAQDKQIHIAAGAIVAPRHGADQTDPDSVRMTGQSGAGLFGE
jgi:hypothetical protein